MATGENKTTTPKEHQRNQTTTAVVIQPQRGGFGVGPPYVIPTGHRDWNTGLCGCTEDKEICVKSLLCGWCLSCTMSTGLGEESYTALHVGYLPLRLKLRMILGIRGSVMNDCWILYFCGYCATCQMAREMKTAGLMN